MLNVFGGAPSNFSGTLVNSKCFSIIASIVIPISTMLATSVFNFILISLGKVTAVFLIGLEIGLTLFSGLLASLMTFYLGGAFCSG